MDATPQLWLDPDQYAELSARLEAERRAARELDARLITEWAESEQCSIAA